MSGRSSRVRLYAVLLSGLACPGAGQIFKRHYVRGAVLVAASLALVTAVVAKTWTAMLELVLNTPPDQMLTDVFAIAHRIMIENAAFFTNSGYLFLALWLVGIIDAALSKPRAPKDGGRED